MHNHSILYIFTQNCADSQSAADGLDALMASCAMDLSVNVVFLHDGVFILKKGQGNLDRDDPMAPYKQVYKTFTALDDFGVDQVWVYDVSMASRGLGVEDLSLPVTVCDRQALADQIRAHDQVLVF